MEDFILSFIKYEILISLPLFIWSSYSIWKKYKKYLYVSRRIIDFIYTSSYIDVWVLLFIFFIQIFLYPSL
jgi:predicted nucleotidyltransferase